MKFVENVNQCWKWFSVQAMAIAVAIQGTWPMIPPEMKETIPSNAVHAITAVLLVAGIVGRTVKQSDPK
jgi:hypothetical protein